MHGTEGEIGMASGIRITVVGVGYVGLVIAACLAETGNEVVCADVDLERSTR